MEIVLRNGDDLIKYELSYDETKLQDLMDRIAKSCCFRIYGTYDNVNNIPLIASSVKEAYKKIDEATNIAGYKLYEDIDISSIKIDKNNSVTFRAYKNMLPMLYTYLYGISKGYSKSYLAFQNYNHSIELVPYYQREIALIKNLKENVRAINSIDNRIDNVEIIVSEIKRLKKEKEDNKDYDFNLLRSYYLEALDLLELKEIGKMEVINNPGSSYFKKPKLYKE